GALVRCCQAVVLEAATALRSLATNEPLAHGFLAAFRNSVAEAVARALAQPLAAATGGAARERDDPEDERGNEDDQSSRDLLQHRTLHLPLREGPPPEPIIARERAQPQIGNPRPSPSGGGDRRGFGRSDRSRRAPLSP